MSMDKFKRVLWRLQEMESFRPGAYSHKQIRLAIMEEIGTDQRTIDETIKKMAELKMLHRAGIGWMSVSKEHTQK